MTGANDVTNSHLQRVRPDEIACLGEFVRKSISFKADQLIFRQGETASFIYRVEQGAVRTYRILADGRRYILSFHSPGEWFGLENGEDYDDFAEAIDEVHLLRFLVADSRSLPVSLLALAMKNLAMARERQLALVCQSATGRVAAFILEMAEHFGSSQFELFMPRRDVADYLGLTVESVARSFTKLTSSCVIRMEGRSHRIIRILNRNKLKSMADHGAYDQ